MATRVNYRLLAIIGLLVFIALTIVGGLLFLRLRGNVERNIRTAHEYRAEEDWGKASSYYGRVLSKQPGHREALDGFLDVYPKIIPETRERANTSYVKILTIMKQAALYAPESEKKQRMRDVLEEHYLAAVLTGEQGFWMQLSDITNDYIARATEEDDLVARAYFLRGLSNLHLNDEELTSEIDGLGNIRFPGESDFEKHIELVPSSDVGWAKLAFGRMAVARRLGLESRFAQEERNLKLARDTFARAVEHNPTGVWTTLELLRDAYVEKLWHIGKSVRDPGSVSQAKMDALRLELDEALEAAETAILADGVDDVPAVMNLIRYLRLADGFKGEKRVIALLDESLKQRPGSDRFLYNMGMSQLATGDLDGAYLTGTALMESEPKAVSLEARSQWGYRMAAAKLVFDVSFGQYSVSEGRERAAHYKAMLATRERLDELIGATEANPLLLEVDAKIAMANRRWGLAAKFFEEEISLIEPDDRTFRLAASALEQNGQAGLAEERYQDALRANPNDLRNHMALADFYARQRLPEKGLAIYDRLPRSILEGNEILMNSYQSLQVLASPTDVVPDSVLDPTLRLLAKSDRLIKDDNVEGARSLLAAERASGNTDLRLQIALAHVLSMEGRTDECMVIIDEVIAANPTNHRLKQLRVRYGDPIEGIKLLCAERYSDPLERDAMIHENLRTLQKLRLNLATQLEGAGQADKAAEQRQIADAAGAAMSEYRDSALQAVTSISGAFIGRFEELIANSEFEEARAMLPMARENNFDQSEGNLAEARLELMEGKSLNDAGQDGSDHLRRGMAAAQRATELTPWSDLTWRTLAWGHEMQGDLADAERAYGESLRVNPGHGATLQKYVMLLLRPNSDQSRAVSVLRESIDRFRGNPVIRDLWLEVEARYGDPATAILERRTLWESDPDDRNNALRYAALLARLEPSHELVLDDEGVRAINPRLWLGLSSAKQAVLLDDLQSQWGTIMDAILDHMGAEDDEDFSQAILHARVHVDRGYIDEGVKSIRRYLGTQEASERLALQTRAAAQFLIDADRMVEATQLLEDAVDGQSADREIDFALGSVLYGQGLYSDAIPYLRSAVAVNKESLLRHRLIESLLRTQQFEEARTQLSTLRTIGERPYELAMLEAFLANRESILAGASGDAAAEVAAVGRYRTKLAEARVISPDQPRPLELLIEDLLSEHVRTQDPLLLEEAVRVLDSASSLARRSEVLMLAQANVYVAMGNSRRAINDMEAFIRSNPIANRIRNKLVQAHVNAGNADLAKTAIQAAIVQDPEAPDWYEALGRFHQQDGDMKAATDAFVEAFTRAPSRRLMLLLNDATRSSEPWGHEAILQMAKGQQRLLESDPMMQVLHAKALARANAKPQAKSRIRQARDLYIRSIQQDMLPPNILASWYEDVQIVFADEDALAGEAFANGLIEGTPTLDDVSGLSIYWAKWETPEAWDRSIARQETAVELATTAYPDRVIEMLSRLGSLQLSAGREGDAAGTFHRVVELTPDDRMALNNYAYLLATIRHQPEEALPFAERAIHLGPDSPVIIDTMATIQGLLGNHEAALTGRLKQLEYQPRNADVLAAISLLYSDHTSNPEKAVEFAERATKLRPRDPALMDLSGWAAYRAGQTAKGEDLVSQSIRREPTARAHLHLAEIFLDQNRVEKAREQLRLAVEIADDDSIKRQAEQLRGRLSSSG